MVEGLLTGVVAIAAVRGLVLLLDTDKHSALFRALSQVGATRIVQPLDAYLAAIAAAENHYGTGAVEVATLLNDLAVVYKGPAGRLTIEFQNPKGGR